MQREATFICGLATMSGLVRLGCLAQESRHELVHRDSQLALVRQKGCLSRNPTFLIKQ